MTAREVSELRRLLDAVADRIPPMSRRLEVLFSVAFDRVVSDAVTVQASREGWSLDGVGQGEAKEAWRVLSGSARHALVQLEASIVAANRLLAGGDGADVSLRGTLLGSDGESADRELGRLVSSQARRVARGEFDPARSEPQPGVPRR